MWGKVTANLHGLHRDGTLHYYTGRYIRWQSVTPAGDSHTQDWDFYVNEGSMIEAVDASATFDQLAQPYVHVLQFCSRSTDCANPFSRDSGKA
jgi:hypothetical protein